MHTLMYVLSSIRCAYLHMHHEAKEVSWTSSALVLHATKYHLGIEHGMAAVQQLPNHYTFLAKTSQIHHAVSLTVVESLTFNFPKTAVVPCHKSLSQQGKLDLIKSFPPSHA